MVAVCNSPSRMATWFSRTGDPAVGLASGPAGHGRVTGPDPPDRGAASIGAKDRRGAAASDSGAGAAPLGAWQVAQQLSGVRPGGQVGLGDHAGRTVSHPSFHVASKSHPRTRDYQSTHADLDGARRGLDQLPAGAIDPRRARKQASKHILVELT